MTISKINSESNHLAKVQKYFYESRFSYAFFTGGYKHHGYHPLDRKVSQREAFVLRQKILADKLDLFRNMRVLDAGCGQGKVATYLAEHYDCKVDGITVVPFEAEQAKELVKKAHLESQVRIHLMDYNALEFPDSSFDRIFTMETLSHSANLQRTMEEFYRVLKPGAKFAFFEYAIADDLKFSDKERESLAMICEGTAMDALMKEFRYGAFEDLLTTIGFVNINVAYDTEHSLPTVAHYRKIGFVPYVFIKALGLRRKFVNFAAMIEFYPMLKKDLIRFVSFTGEKPK